VKYNTDQDGKSKTASAVDQQHYPEQHEVKNPDLGVPGHLTHDEHARGRQEGSAEQDWLEAEAELRAYRESRNVLQSTANKGGSVQHE
jgi:hypothetical protein